MPKTYRTKLPRPDARGYYRPEVGGVRFTIGNESSVSKGEAQRRLDTLKELFERQCEHEQIDFWAGWVLPYAKKVAAGEALTYPTIKRNVGQALEDLRSAAMRASSVSAGSSFAS